MRRFVHRNDAAEPPLQQLVAARLRGEKFYLEFNGEPSELVEILTGAREWNIGALKYTYWNFLSLQDVLDHLPPDLEELEVEFTYHSTMDFAVQALQRCPHLQSLRLTTGSDPRDFTFFTALADSRVTKLRIQNYPGIYEALCGYLRLDLLTEFEFVTRTENESIPELLFALRRCAKLTALSLKYFKLALAHLPPLLTELTLEKCTSAGPEWVFPPESRIATLTLKELRLTQVGLPPLLTKLYLDLCTLEDGFEWASYAPGLRDLSLRGVRLPKSVLLDLQPKLTKLSMERCALEKGFQWAFLAQGALEDLSLRFLEGLNPDALRIVLGGVLRNATMERLVLDTEVVLTGAQYARIKRLKLLDDSADQIDGVVEALTRADCIMEKLVLRVPIREPDPALVFHPVNNPNPAPDPNYDPIVQELRDLRQAVQHPRCTLTELVILDGGAFAQEFVERFRRRPALLALLQGRQIARLRVHSAMRRLPVDLLRLVGMMLI